MLKDSLQGVLDWAHSQHEYVTDLEQYRKSEHWMAGLTGDCEDFALACRDQLEQRVIHPDLVFCRTEDGSGHLVLHVEGWILDNRHKWVMRQDDLPYEWIKIGVPNNTSDTPYTWYWIK